jgi:prolipoprotein diacylglyceryltransferase
VPTPLLSALLALVASAVGLVVLFRGGAAGSATAAALLVYGTLRTGVEHTRDEARFGRVELTMGQLFSLPIGLSAMALWLALPAHAGPLADVRVEVSVLAAMWPALPVLFAMVFAVCGYHKKDVGSW